jgi:hypothetical protein
VSRVHEPWTQCNAGPPWPALGSPESCRLAASVDGSSPRRTEKEEGSGGVLTEVEIGRLDVGVRPAVKRSKRRQWRSMMGGFGAQRGGEKGSTRCGEA